MASALATQGRVIYALVLRQISVAHGKSMQGYFWQLFDSAWQICFFLIMRSYRGFAPPQGMSILLFILSGFVPFLIFKQTVRKNITIFQKKSKLLNIPAITNLDLCIAAMIFAWITEMIVACLFVAGGFFFDIEFKVDDWSKFLFVLIISPVMGLGAGTFCASLVVLFPVLGTIITIILQVSMFISGVFYSVSKFPSFIMDYLWYNPLLQMIEIIRSGIATGYDAMNYSISYVASFTVCILCLGLLMERYIRRHRL